MFNQNRSISILVISGQNTKAIALLSGQNWLICHHFSMFNQNSSMSILVIFGQNTKAIALLFGQNRFICHHFSMFNQNRSISILVIFGQNTKAIALPSGQNWLICHHFSMFNQNPSISILVIFGQNTKAIAFFFWPKLVHMSSLFNVQSKSIDFNSGHFWAKYQGYSLTFWPELAHFHHFSMFKQNPSSSILVMFGQNTKAIALLFGQNWFIFITFQCSFKLDRFQFWSFLGKIPRL